MINEQYIRQYRTQWLDQLFIRESSKKVYSSQLETFLLYCQQFNKPVETFSVKDAAEMYNFVISNYTPSAAKFKLTVFKMFWKWLQENNYSLNVMAGLKMPRQKQEPLKEPLTADKLRKLKQVLKDDTTIHRRDKLIIMLMITAGLRCVEISRMDVGDFEQRNVNGEQLLCLKIQRKGHHTKDDFIQIESLRQPIFEHLAELPTANNDQPVFISHSFNKRGRRFAPNGIGSIVKTYLDEAGVRGPRVTPHSLRHTAAYMLVSSKQFDLDSIQLFLGHTHSEITRIYTAFSNHDKKLQNNAGAYLHAAFANA